MNASNGHCSTVERLYAWEKKLFQEVKVQNLGVFQFQFGVLLKGCVSNVVVVVVNQGAETIKIEHEKRVGQLRKLEVKRADYIKTEKTKKEVEKLESQMMVASQAIETTSSEIIKLGEAELFPQLLELVKGLVQLTNSNQSLHSRTSNDVNI